MKSWEQIKKEKFKENEDYFERAEGLIDVNLKDQFLSSGNKIIQDLISDGFNYQQALKYLFEILNK